MGVIYLPSNRHMLSERHFAAWGLDTASMSDWRHDAVEQWYLACACRGQSLPGLLGGVRASVSGCLEDAAGVVWFRTGFLYRLCQPRLASKGHFSWNLCLVYLAWSS